MSNQKMAGGGNPRGSSSHKSSSSSTYRKSRWESGNSTTTTTPSDNKPAAVSDPKSSKPVSNQQQQSSKPKDDPVPGPSKPPTDPILPSPSSGKFHPPGHGPPPFRMPELNGSPFADPSGFGPPPPPAYGFHMLERRTIVLADGNVRSYFALPPDYQDFPLPGRPGDHPDRFLPFGPGGGGGGREPEQGGMGIGFDKHFPPEGFHRGGGGGREEMYGRGGGGQSDYWNSLGLDGRGPEGSLKRKYGDEDERDGRDDFARQRQQLLQYGNPSSNPNGFPGDRVDYLGGAGNPFHRDSMLSGRGIDDLRSSKHIRVGGGDYGSSHSRHGEPGNDASLKHPEVDSNALKKAFIHFTKSLIETPQRKNFLEDGKHGPLQCLACGRVSQDMHGLIMHTYTSPDLRVDHLGFHKALCVLMGWNYAKAPDNSKAYQSLSADEAAANKEDLVMWPPTVIIRNTNSGRGKDGRMEGMGNKMMDNKLKDLGFVGGKSKSLYGKDGHLGITLVKFTGDQSGLKDAIRLAEYFEKDNHGRKGWARAQSSMTGRDEESNPNLVKMDEKTREKTRIHYGYLGTASDLDDVDFETRTKSSLESRREFKI